MNLTNREMFDKDQVAEWRRKAAALDVVEQKKWHLMAPSKADPCWRFGLLKGDTALEAIEAALAAQGEG